MSLFPTFEIFLENGGKLYSLKSSSLSYQLGYGQTSAYTITGHGETAYLLESTLTEGSVLKEIYAGYKDSRLELLARNIIVWETDFSVGDDGLMFTGYAYGCSQFLRNSGQRTETLVAKTYGDAAREVCARWGLRVTIGEGANTAIDSSSKKPVQMLHGFVFVYLVLILPKHLYPRAVSCCHPYVWWEHPQERTC